MAVVLKTGKTYNPQISQSYGMDMTNGDYYGAIDTIEYNKAEKQCNFSLSIYSNEESRTNDKSVVDRLNFNFHGDNFDSQIGNDGITIPQAYARALADSRLADWESDE